jgi:hypothetical protein
MLVVANSPHLIVVARPAVLWVLVWRQCVLGRRCGNNVINSNVVSGAHISAARVPALACQAAAVGPSIACRQVQQHLSRAVRLL